LILFTVSAVVAFWIGFAAAQIPEDKRAVPITGFNEVQAQAEKGDPKFQVALGMCYKKGLGVKKDIEIAFGWWLKAASAGYAPAQRCVGRCYATGEGTNKDPEQFLKWISMAAGQGDPPSMYMMGSMHLDGDQLPRDTERAHSWLVKAGNEGDLQAQITLGLAYVQGSDGFPRDFDEACKWLAMGAAQDEERCLYLLGSAYETGAGVPKDLMHARRLWLRSAELGFMKAQTVLGQDRLLGNFVSQNFVHAYSMLKLGADGGDEKALKLLESARIHLTADELHTAELMAAAFKPRAQERRAVLAEMRTVGGGSYGTGFCISENGHFVTCAHLLGNAKRIWIHTGQKERAPAEIVAICRNSDLAILKSSRATGSSCLPIVTSKDINPGAPVFTVGYPGRTPSRDFSSVALAKGEIVALAGVLAEPCEFQTTVAVYPGNSGGPLVDALGNVVGVSSHFLGDAEGTPIKDPVGRPMSFAVKSNLLLNLVDSVPGLLDELRRPFSQAGTEQQIISSAEAALVWVEVE
jgi:TPR repeat protein